MSKRFSLQPRSIGLTLLSSLGVLIGIGLAELQPAQADCPPNSWAYKAELIRAKAELKDAEADRNRMRLLVEAGAVPRQDLDNAESRYQRQLATVNALVQGTFTFRSPNRQSQLNWAESQVEYARANLDRYRILFREGAISKSAMLGAEQEYQEAVKRRDDLRRPSSEVRDEPRSPSACDQPKTMPTPNPQVQESQGVEKPIYSKDPIVPNHPGR